ncbi:hypothetical protein [Terriglobus saanensis]|uniref:Uncharacterized protein n=1 Tax=Terriglobus saanensis (strain ATCC BAA-1853 / DSM 23119 / SP1PR4) TaxID=401053 RepID=E8V7E8_TERSS|nr:hypothetical protein [Terriglobus saanensis]ADV83922.1 hypothetical protein AciPR4_3166 [Terriglobus saanensis SP1PR4]
MAHSQIEAPDLSDAASEVAPPKLADKFASAQKSAQTLKWSNPAVIGLLATALGLVGNLAMASYNDRSTRELNRAKMQADLIQQAVNTHSLQQSCRNLLFFIDTAFISDSKGKITQQCLYPLPQTEIPFSNAVASTAAAGTSALQAVNASSNMGIKVTRSDQPDAVRYQVSFTVPNEPNNPTFNTVKIYCTQLTNRERTQSKIYPEMQGNWRPGDRVSFTIDVPTKLANTQTGWNLTFCVGTDSACYPSPNLLKFIS